MFAAWPALDHHSADFKIWIDKDGRRSPAYTIQLANGRSTFTDAWELPAGFSGLEGRHVRLRFRDLLGQTRTWCGDWRESMDRFDPTQGRLRTLPPDYRGPVVY